MRAEQTPQWYQTRSTPWTGSASHADIQTVKFGDSLVHKMPGTLQAVSDPISGQADKRRDAAGHLQVPTPESPMWYPQVAKTGQQGLGSSLPKFGLSSVSSQPGHEDAGLYSTDTLPSLSQYELPLLKSQKVCLLGASTVCQVSSNALTYSRNILCA